MRQSELIAFSRTVLDRRGRHRVLQLLNYNDKLEQLTREVINSERIILPYLDVLKI